MANDQGKLISAGDLEKFSYCPLSWKLSKGFDPEDEALERGIEEHKKLGTSLWKIDAKEKAARESETLVMWFAVVASVIAVVGLELLPFEEAIRIGEIMGAVALIWILAATFFLFKATRSTIHSKTVDYEKLVLVFAIASVIIAVNAVAFLYTDVRMAQVLEALSLIWLVAASFFLYRSLKATDIVESLRKEFRVEGKIEYFDTDGSRMFVSEKYGLTGRPDYVIKLGEHIIPVEEKKGRTPKGPLFSHILQISAYCLLIEDNFGRAPPYGLLKYPEHEHEIEYNEAMKKALLEKLSDMRKVIRTGEAHRDHNRPGKCRSCSRREACPERLE